jgi:hypothetical protein
MPISLPWSGSGSSRQARMRERSGGRQLADLVARSELEVPIAGLLLDDVRDAFRESNCGTRGKLVLRP